MQSLPWLFVVFLLPSIALADPARNTPPADPFPNGCVDCHVQLPDRDVRLSTVMNSWRETVPPALLEKVRQAAPDAKFTGKHPAAPMATSDVPATCLSCHGGQSSAAPPLGTLLHAIHLGGGDGNHFVTLFQGSCTHCHKLRNDGTLIVANGAEKP